MYIQVTIGRLVKYPSEGPSGVVYYLPGVYIPLTRLRVLDFSYGNTRGLSVKIISRCGENTPHRGVKYPAMRGKYPALRGKFPAWGVIDTPRVAAG
jgi:hypothetical protein